MDVWWTSFPNVKKNGAYLNSANQKTFRLCVNQSKLLIQVDSLREYLWSDEGSDQNPDEAIQKIVKWCWSEFHVELIRSSPHLVLGSRSTDWYRAKQQVHEVYPSHWRRIKMIPASTTSFHNFTWLCVKNELSVTSKDSAVYTWDWMIMW